MAVKSGTVPAGSQAVYAGKQIRKERVARGWSLDELAKRTKIHPTHLSRLENGIRSLTRKAAEALDQAFPERRGWFTEYHEETRSWAPPAFRNWAEHEDKASQISDWWPTIISGLLQTSDYARAHISTYPASREAVDARIANRMTRQSRVLFRDDPPEASILVDHAALYRLMGTPEIMAAQCGRLAEIAELPHVTLQVLPAVGHPATSSGFMLADSGAAYVEHVAGGAVYADGDAQVATLRNIFRIIRAECYRASESLAVLRKAQEVWNSETGESRASAAQMAGRVSKPRRVTA
jgi:transcriptional regulator with XRE-family HTH domain